MARPRKPTALHVVDGTFRKDRHAGAEVQPTLPIGDPPDWLEGEALAEWQRLLSDPPYAAVLFLPHRGALLEYCVLFARMIEDAKGGATMNSSQRQNLNSLRMQLGITPASQSKVKIQKAAPSNPWAEVG